MAVLGETSSRMIVSSTLGFIFPNGSIIHNDNGVYFQSSTLVPIQVSYYAPLVEHQMVMEMKDNVSWSQHDSMQN